MAPQGQHILVIRLSAMGDVAMTVPVLRILLHSHPTLKITVLTRKVFAPFFEGIDRLSIQIADVKGAHKGLFGLRRLAKTLKSQNIDAVADLHEVLRTKVLKFFLPGSLSWATIDKGRQEKAALTRRDHKIKKQLKTSFQRYADVFEELGYPLDLHIDLPVEQKDIDADTTALLQRLCPNLDDYTTWIGIAPFAKHTGKMYPIDLMEEVIAALVPQRHLIFLLGGREDYDLLQAIDNQYDNVINIATKLTLQEELALIQKMRVVLSMDSANMHMASLVGTRVISIWGATHPYAGFLGWRQRMEDALFPDAIQYPDLPCSVYGKEVYPGYEECMRSIEPEVVVNHISSVLEEL